jgi:hypothetical protein
MSFKKKKKIEKHGARMVCSEKMVMEDGCNVFFFHFLGIKILVKFDPEIAKLVNLHLKNKKNSKFSQFLCRKMVKSCQDKKPLDGRLKN